MSTESKLRGAFVLLFGFAIGVFVGFGLDDTGEKSSPKTPVPSVTGAGPTREVNGVPVGYARTEEGAVAAARGFALLTATDLIRDRDAFVEAMETTAAPGWVEDARRQAVNGYEFLVGRY
ncbi:MAG: hypothetical protein ACRDJI_09090, partial [Actinomycetota bacterium]